MKQYEVYLIALDPTIGHEIKKTRPGIIISPNEMNDNIGTVVIAPMTTKSHDYPSRVSLKFLKKQGWIMLDQIRCIDKSRLIKKLGNIGEKEIQNVKEVLKEMFVD
jgi:mRNA interferase MazF